MTTKAHILKTAADLLQKNSLAGFSFQDIADRVGIRKASLFHHYPSKEALVAEILVRSLEQLQQLKTSVLHRPATDQLEAFLDLYCDDMGAGSQLCPVGGVLGSWDSLPASVRNKADALLRFQLDWLGDICLAGEWVTTGQEARNRAEYMLALLQGALVLARTQGDSGPMRRAADRIHAELR